MKLYDKNTQKIGNYKTIITVDGTLYPSKLSEIQRNLYGFYNVELISPPNRRYYTFTESKGLVENKYKNSFTVEDKNINEVKKNMLEDLFNTGIEYEESASVDTGLGFIVDASPRGMSAFALGAKKSITKVRDNNFMPHNVSVPQVNDILTSIEDNLMAIFNTKEDKFDTILTLTTVAECEAYENEPYNYVITAEDVVNDIEDTLTEGQIVIRHRNNVKEW